MSAIVSINSGVARQAPHEQLRLSLRNLQGFRVLPQELGQRPDQLLMIPQSYLDVFI